MCPVVLTVFSDSAFAATEIRSLQLLSVSMKLEIAPSGQSWPAHFYRPTASAGFQSVPSPSPAVVSSTIMPVELSTYNPDSPTRAHVVDSDPRKGKVRLDFQLNFGNCRANYPLSGHFAD